MEKGRSSRNILNYIRQYNISYIGTETSYSRNIHSYMFMNPNQMNIILKECEELNSTCGINIEQLKKMVNYSEFHLNRIFL